MEPDVPVAQTAEAGGDSPPAAPAADIQPIAPKRCLAKQAIACPQDVLLASVTLALTLSKGRSQYEIETLINLFSLTTNNLQSILAQLLINNRAADELDVIL
ncbi:MAG: hypothetical protein RR197_00645 [Oscillospiraceae bacterium]